MNFGAGVNVSQTARPNFRTLAKQQLDRYQSGPGIMVSRDDSFNKPDHSGQNFNLSIDPNSGKKKKI